MNTKSFTLANKIKTLLDAQKLSVISTRGKIYPYSNLVAYAFTEDLKYIFFATKKHTHKYENILKYPYVSMIIDSRKNNTKDFEDAVALTVTGKFIKSQERLNKEIRKIYLKRFPNLKSFLDNSDTIIILLEIDKYIFVQKFQEVLELNMK